MTVAEVTYKIRPGLRPIHSMNDNFKDGRGNDNQQTKLASFSCTFKGPLNLNGFRLAVNIYRSIEKNIKVMPIWVCPASLGLSLPL